MVAGAHILRASKGCSGDSKTNGSRRLDALNKPLQPHQQDEGRDQEEMDLCGNLRISFQEPGGERQLLSSPKTLPDYGIFSKVNIRVLENFTPEIQAFVKYPDGQSKTFDIEILVLNQKIEDAGGPCVEDQVLLLDKELEDEESLAELEIGDCDTIKLRVIY